MGIRRVVNTDFWKDDVVAEQYSAEDRYFMLYILTNPNTTQCGIYHLPIRTMAFELGYTQEATKSIVERFEKKFKNVVYSKETNEIAVLNFLKHSIIKGGKPVEDCIRKELGKVKNKKLIVIVYKHLIDFMNEQIEYKEKANSTSMYVGIKKVFNEFINENDINNDNDNDNDNDNERIVPRIVDKSLKIKIPYEEIKNLYHEICISYPKVLKLSDSRKKTIAARFKEYGYKIDTFKQLFIKAEESDFLKGKNDRGWGANFDWLLNQRNMVYVLEDKYKNKEVQNARSIRQSNREDESKLYEQFS